MDGSGAVSGGAVSAAVDYEEASGSYAVNESSVSYSHGVVSVIESYDVVADSAGGGYEGSEAAEDCCDAGECDAAAESECGEV